MKSENIRRSIKVVSLGLLLGFLASCAIFPQERTTPLSGVVSGETRWQGTVFIDGDLVLEKEARLVIAPGTEVVFLPPAEGKDLFTERPNFPGNELIIRGALLAEGTSFSYVYISQANSAIHSHSAEATMEDSRIENNLFGLRFNTTDFLIKNNLLRRNGTAIRFHFGAPVIRNNVITDNEKGVFITSYPEDYIIEGNNIFGNHRYAVVLGEEVPDDVIMVGNYWGADNPEAIRASFFDGRKDEYLGNVLFEPFANTSFSSAGVSTVP